MGLDAIFLQPQFFDQSNGRINIDVKIIKDHFTRRIDYDSPGCAPGTVVAHDLRNLVGFLFSSGMCHGDLQIIFYLIFVQFFFGINTVTFKYGLDAHKNDIICFFESFGKLLERWKPNPLATRSPILPKIKIDNLSAVIRQTNWIDILAIAVNPGG